MAILSLRWLALQSIWRVARRIGAVAACAIIALAIASSSQADTANMSPAPMHETSVYTVGRLGFLPKVPDDVKVSINDSDQIAFWHVATNGTVQAFMWQNNQRTTLGVLPGDSSSMAHAINSNGDVVGWSVTGTSLVDNTATSARHAFLYSGGRMQGLGTLGGKDSLAFGINDVGDVVGCSSIAPAVRHAFVYRDGKMTDLGSLPTGIFSEASAINNSGEIVGASEAGKMIMHAVMWPNPSVPTIASAPTGPDGGPIDYGTLLNRTFDDADLTGAHSQGYNNHDIAVMAKIAGRSGVPFRDVDQMAQGGLTFAAIADRFGVPSDCLRDVRDVRDEIEAYRLAYRNTGRLAPVETTSAGGIVDLGTFPGGKLSRAVAINTKGDIAGYSDMKGGMIHGFIDTDGHMLDLGSLGIGPVRVSDINDSDQIVGSSTFTPVLHHAMIWQNGKIDDLNNLIPKDSGWTLLDAYAINNKGQIVCSASTPNSGGSLDSYSFMVLLTPVGSAD